MSNNTRQALCCVCGAVRTLSARCGRDDLRLKCSACKTTTMHAVIGLDPSEDWRERANTRIQPRALRYDPYADARERWPEWPFEVKWLDGADFELDWDEKAVAIAPDFYAEDSEWAMTYVIAQLDLCPDDAPEWLGGEDESRAAFYAYVRLDREEWRW